MKNLGLQVCQMGFATWPKWIQPTRSWIDWRSYANGSAMVWGVTLEVGEGQAVKLLVERRIQL